MSARVLVLNGNLRAGNARIIALGGRDYGEGYADALRFFDPGLDITILNAAEGDALPAGITLADFHGAAWTGSALSAYEDVPEVRRQIELAREINELRIPCFGSCWGQQIMCQALGGEVRANPKGTEIGVARDIRRTAEGLSHPVFHGKADPFDALAIHRDEVCRLPDGATVLAANDMSYIQAMELSGDAGNFWGVQYHPEFDLRIMAALFRRDGNVLLDQGQYDNADQVGEAIQDFSTLQEDPTNATLASKHGLGADILDPGLRMAELGNWLTERVLVRASAA